MGKYSHCSIIVYYCYHRKRDDKWVGSIKGFTSKEKALGFMKSTDDKNKESFVTGWKCDYPDDNDWLFQRHTIKHPAIDGKWWER